MTKTINLWARRPYKDTDLIIPFIVHPNSSGESPIIIINYPGFTGTIGGFAEKYVKLANFLSERANVTVVRMGNHFWKSADYPITVADDLRCVISSVLDCANEIVSSSQPIQLYLMGFSAGASAVAVVASEYEQCCGILLMAPSEDAGHDAITSGLSSFTGSVHAVVGANDEIVGPDAACRFVSLATSASVKEFRVIPDCDHQFRGTPNGRITSQAPLWAFSGLNPFPHRSEGIDLY